MAFKLKSGNTTAFKQMGSSPAKQTIDFWNQTPEEYAEYQKKQKIDHVKRTTDKIHSTEKSIGELKESRNKDIKRNKGKNVKISKKDIVRQMNKSGTKVPYSKLKKALKTSVRKAGKIAKFIPGVAGLVLSATKTATADQPNFPKGSKHYQDPKKKLDFTKTR